MKMSLRLLPILHLFLVQLFLLAFLGCQGPARPPAAGLELPAIASVPIQQENGDGKRVSVEDLSGQVMGRLGVPLGEICEIEAIIFDGGCVKGMGGEYRLLVKKVNGKSLDSEPLLQFTPPNDSTLPPDYRSFLKLKTGRVPRTICYGKVQEMHRGYVGKTVKLRVHESAEMRHFPHPADYVTNLDWGFPSGPVHECRSMLHVHNELK